MTQKFSLQRVLDFKEQLEDILQIEVATIEGRRIELQHAVETMRRKWEETSAQHANGADTLDPAMVEALTTYLDALDRRIRSGDDSLQQVKQELDAKRGELEAAYQERELLQRLKEKQAAQEMKAEQRRDTRALEDMSTSMYVRRNAEEQPGQGARDDRSARERRAI